MRNKSFGSRVGKLLTQCGANQYLLKKTQVPAGGEGVVEKDSRESGTCHFDKNPLSLRKVESREKGERTYR